MVILILKLLYMNKKYYFILFCFFFFFSCDKEHLVDEFIRGKEYKYWINLDSLGTETRFYNYYDKNGKWLMFYINDYGEFIKNESKNSDIVYIEKWFLLNDSTIAYGTESNTYDIVKISKDTMINYNKYSNKYTVSVVAPTNKIPIEYRKLQ